MSKFKFKKGDKVVFIGKNSWHFKNGEQLTVDSSYMRGSPAVNPCYFFKEVAGEPELEYNLVSLELYNSPPLPGAKMKFEIGDVIERSDGSGNKCTVHAVKPARGIYTLIDSDKVKYNAVAVGIDRIYELSDIVQSPLAKALR